MLRVVGNHFQNTHDSISPLGLNPEVRAHIRICIKVLQQLSVGNQVPCLCYEFLLLRRTTSIFVSNYF